ncbi:hypothetical protein Tco_1231522 [Tanacetum coccineum]
MKEQAYNKIKSKTKTQELNKKAISTSPRKQDSMTSLRGRLDNNPIITTTTTQSKSLFLPSPPKSFSQPEGELLKKKGKETITLTADEKESTERDSDDDTIHLIGSMVKFSKKKKLKKFDFVTEGGDYVRLTEEQISKQKKIEDDAKAEAAKLKWKEEEKNWLIFSNLLWFQRPITLKVYREDDANEVIPNFKAGVLHLSEWRKIIKACPNRTNKPLGEQDPMNRLNDLARKKRKHADDIHEFFKANKRLKSLVQYEDHPAGTVLNEPVLGMIMFNSFKRQDFVTIEYFRDFSNAILCSGSETEEGLCRELQSSLADNSKLDVVYLLNKSLYDVSLLEGSQVMGVNFGEPLEDVVYLPSSGLVASADGTSGWRLLHSIESHNKTVTKLCVAKTRKESGEFGNQFRIMGVSLDRYLKVFESTRVVGTSSGILYASRRKSEGSIVE